MLSTTYHSQIDGQRESIKKLEHSYNTIFVVATIYHNDK